MQQSSKHNMLSLLLLLTFVCGAFSQSAACGSGHGLLATTGDCLCESGYYWDSSTCAVETTSCSIPLPDDLNSPLPVTLGAGVSADSFLLNVNVPLEQTRILANVTFDLLTTSVYDYPAAFATYTRTLTQATCSDSFLITIPTASLPASITATTTSSSIEYTGTLYITCLETLSDGSTRSIFQEFPFDYTFPIASSSFASMDVISSIGTVLKSNILQQATTGNQIQVVIRLSTPFPYQLDWVDQAPVTGTKFSGTDVTLPTKSPLLTYTLDTITPCASTAQGTMCVQTASLFIDYSSGCSVDGSYVLDFAVTGCNTAGGTTPSVDCLNDNTGTAENIPVTVTISALVMGDLCTDSRVFHGTAGSLVAYAESSFTTPKSSYISDAAQSSVFLQADLTIGPDTLSLLTYTGFSILAVSRMCAGVSTCTASYVAFPALDVVDHSTDYFHIKVEIPVADFVELTNAESDIPYALQLEAALLFSDNSKRSVKTQIDVRAPAGSITTKSSGNIQFLVQNKNITTTTPTQAPTCVNAPSNNAGVVSITSSLLLSCCFVVMFACVGIIW